MLASTSGATTGSAPATVVLAAIIVAAFVFLVFTWATKASPRMIGVGILVFVVCGLLVFIAIRGIGNVIDDVNNVPTNFPTVSNT